MSQRFSQPLTVPHAATAQRPQWSELPADVRALIQDQLGAEVLHSTSQNSGYTPGFAARTELADGRRFFIKVASSDRPWMFESYANEAAKRRTLPAGVPAPELVRAGSTRLGDRDWLVLIFADVDGGPPRRPWTTAELQAAVQAVQTSAIALDPAPPGFDWLPLSVELGGLSPDKEDMIEREFADHADELRELVSTFDQRCHGPALVHADLRDDNMIIDTAGKAWICDWNFPLLGPRWVDLVTLLISARGDGHDVERVLAESPLVEPADSDGIDSLLADLALYYAIAWRQPEPDTSRYLREHQRWNGRVTADWLAERRGWR
jgi:hypothetical protein